MSGILFQIYSVVTLYDRKPIYKRKVFDIECMCNRNNKISKNREVVHSYYFVFEHILARFQLYTPKRRKMGYLYNNSMAMQNLLTGEEEQGMEPLFKFSNNVSTQNLDFFSLPISIKLGLKHKVLVVYCLLYHGI